MQNLMRILFIIYCITVCVLSVSAQRKLSGKVTLEDGKPLAGAMVSIYDGKKHVAYGSSRQDGCYEITIPETYAKRQLTVNFRKLNYKEQTYALPVGTTSISTVMTSGSKTLSEVVVKAPPAIQKGDTLRFFMGQFATGTDLSLEEGLKRIPGITVSEDGGISYMGRNISQFYVEGLNLLGGRYNLATRNIPVDKVTGVEVLRHHQKNKVDKNDLTNDVALNIRLSEKAKVKPFGTYEVRAGVENEKNPLYGLGGTAMLFRKNLQMLTTLKLSNDGRLGADETKSHFSNLSWKSGAEQVLPLLSGSRPPFAAYRYMNERKDVLSVNTLQRLTEDNQLKINANYNYDRADYDYKIGSRYYMGETLYETQEQADFLQKAHKATMDVEFRSDKEKQLIENTFSLYGRFADAESNAVQNSETYQQMQEQDAFGVRNAFSLIRRVRKWKWQVKGDVQYVEAPKGDLNILMGKEPMAFQEVGSQMFRTEESFYTGYEILPGLTLAFPVIFALNTNSLQTQLERETATVRNELCGWDMKWSAVPGIHYQTADRSFRIGADFPLNLLWNDYENRVAGRQMKFNRNFVDASLSFQYIINAQSGLEGRSDWRHLYGDYFSLLGNPIQTDYRTQQIRSGTFGSSRVSQSSLIYEWQSPLSFWFFNAGISYAHSFSNTMKGQNLNGDDLSFTEQLMENTGNNIYLDSKLSKYLFEAKTHLTIGGHYQWSESQMFSGGNPTMIYSRAYGGYLEARANPIVPLDLSYRADGTYSKQDISEQKSHHTNITQYFHLTYSPIEAFNLRAGGEWRYTTLTDGNHKKTLLLDARLEYKIPLKKIRLRLEMNNLLNRQSYSYTVYDGLNTYSYDYRLRGREFLLSFIWM